MGIECNKDFELSRSLIKSHLRTIKEDESNKESRGFILNHLGWSFYQQSKYLKAKKYYEKAITQNNKFAMTGMAVLHEDGVLGVQDFKKAAELYEKAAELGDSSAMVNLSRIYLTGNHQIEKDIPKASSLLQAAIDLVNLQTTN